MRVLFNTDHQILRHSSPLLLVSPSLLNKNVGYKDAGVQTYLFVADPTVRPTNEPSTMLPEENIRRYDAMTEAQLRNALRQYGSQSEHWAYIHVVLRERMDSASREEVAKLRHDVSDIRERLRSSEWRTWTLWFAFIGIIIAGLGLLRDYLNLQRPDSAPSHAEPAIPSTPSLPVVPSLPPAPAPPVSAPAPADTKATAPTDAPKS